MSVDVLIVEDLAQQKLPARCAAAALQSQGLSVHLADLNDGPAAMVATAQAELPRLVIASILFADRIDEHLALMTALRREGLCASLTLVGHLPSLDHPRFLDACPALDSVLRGDAETWAPQLARCVIGGADWVTVPGLISRSHKGSLPLYPPPNTNLDNYSEPSRELMPSFRGFPFATIESSRGCYHACSFCLPSACYRAQGAPYRLRPVPEVVGEMQALYRRGVRLFLFDDDEFLPPSHARIQRIEEFAAELQRHDLQIAFTIKCRADDVEAGAFQRLKEIGLLRVYLGVESGCQETLDLFDKHTTVRQNEEALATLQALGIVADYRCLPFHPWTTLETIEKDLGLLQKALSISSTLFDMREVQVYPGTPLAHRLVIKRGGDLVPGPVSYIIADPQAEYVRRLNRIVFESSAALQQVRQSVTEGWYALLLAKRFQSDSCLGEQARDLQRGVSELNAALLAIWNEMVKNAREADVLDRRALLALGAEWAGELESACVRANRASPLYGIRLSG